MNGAFVTGNGNAAVGTSVEFWGSEWWKLNDLSEGSAPASFKGFASTLSAKPPHCGVTWTTQPGGSSMPPATLPTYMGVLVAPSVSKSGSTISDGASSIVVVKVDPGYTPDPSTPGTGVVVARVCP